MKKYNKRPRKLMRARNKNRVNRIKNQQALFSPFVLVFISLNLGELTTPEKLLARLRMHIERLTGNANFPVTDPTIAAMQDLADDLEDMIDAVNGGNKALIPDREALVVAGEEMLHQLSFNIQYLSKGDEVKIKSTGFDVRKTQGATQTPAQIANLAAIAAGPGKVKLKWARESHSRVYFIQSNTNPTIEGQWQMVGTTRNVSFVVEDLVPGQLYYFRVYGTNGNENGNPSDVAEQRSL